MIVQCELRKWDGFPTYRYEADLLGRDGFGTWLGLPPPAPYSGPKGEGVWKHASVVVVPTDEWWIATFNDEREPEGRSIYVDVTTVPEWSNGSVIRAIDLDLDVVRFLDGRTELQDEDEFDERRVAMGYPDDVVDRARKTAQSLLAAVEAREEPFRTVGPRWLGEIE